MVDAFCLDPMGGNAVAEALGTEKDRRFASEINTMLLERAARIAAACLCAILRERGFGAGKLTGICADGTMLKLNPVLRPRMEALIAEYTKRHGLGGAEFLFAGDATLSAAPGQRWRKQKKRPPCVKGAVERSETEGL